MASLFLRFMPSRVLAVLAFALLFLLFLPAGLLQAAPREVTVALVQDGPITSGTDPADLFQEEIAQVLGSDFSVAFRREPALTGDFTLAGVNRALDQAEALDDVDLVVCVGAIGSTAAVRRDRFEKPTIAALAYASPGRELPLDRGGSGVPNLTYVAPALSLMDELAKLLALVPDLQEVPVLGSDGLFEALALEGGTEQEDRSGGLHLYAVRVGSTSAEALAAIPADAQAVLLPTLIGFTDEEVDALLEGLKERKIPSLALGGETMVRRGALMGTLPGDWTSRLVRRTALNARKILSGQPAAGLPVSLATDAGFYINMETARAVDVAPPFAVLVDAVVIDPQRKEGRRLTLHSTMHEAMEGNKDLQTMEQALEVARREVGQARARLLPQLEAGVTGSLLDEDRAQAALRPSEQSWTAGITATQVLYSDDVWTAFDAQKSALAARQAEYDQTRLDVALEAATAYFQVLRALTAENIQRTNLASSRQNLERAGMRVRLGIANRSELLRWQSKIATEKADMIDATVQRNLAEMELNRLLGRPAEESILLVEPVLDADLSLLADPRVADLMTNGRDLRLLRRYLADFALMVSPELARLDAGISSQRRVVSNRQRSFFVPDVALSFGWSHYLSESGAGAEDADRAVWPLDDSEWSAALSFSLPLFEGGGRFADRAQAGHELLRLRLARAATAERIEQRVRAAVHVTSGRFAAIELSRQAAEASRENLELVNDAYGQGAVDLITQLDAQTAALQAQLAAADANYAFLQALMEAERSTGGFTLFLSNEEKQSWLQDLEAWISTQER